MLRSERTGRWFPYVGPSKQSIKGRRITDTVYDANGINLQSVTVSGATGRGSVTKTSTYDSLGRVQTETLQRRISATDPTLLDLTTTFEYDAPDWVVNVTDARGDIRDEGVRRQRPSAPGEGALPHHNAPGGLCRAGRRLRGLYLRLPEPDFIYRAPLKIYCACAWRCSECSCIAYTFRLLRSGGHRYDF